MTISEIAHTKGWAHCLANSNLCNYLLSTYFMPGTISSLLILLKNQPDRCYLTFQANCSMSLTPVAQVLTGEARIPTRCPKSSLPSSAPVCTWFQCFSRTGTRDHRWHSFYHIESHPWKQSCGGEPGKKLWKGESFCVERQEAVIPRADGALNVSLPGQGLNSP